MNANENPETFEMTEQDYEDLRQLGVDQDEELTVTVLEAWRELLSNIEASAAEKITPQIASRVCGSWRQMTVQDLPLYFEEYHAILFDLREVLHAVIDQNPGALLNVKTDAQDNREEYLELILLWQQVLGLRDHEWDCTAENAHVTLAALGDAQAFLFDPTGGIVNHLSAIGFEHREDDMAAISQAMQEWKAEL